MHRRIISIALVVCFCLACTLASSARQSSAAQPLPPGRPHPGPQATRAEGLTAWVSPGPAPELWIGAPEGFRAALQGESEQFAVVQWAPDGEGMAVLRVPNGSQTAHLGRWWMVDLDGGARPLEAPPQWLQMPPDPSPREMTGFTTPEPDAPIRTTALNPPATIRVYHSSYNSCRTVPVGTITVLPFEEYVARVLAAEVYSSWPSETLQAQAIAIRTYAWYHILRRSQYTYDVTDSTSYQYMCDATYQSTNAATVATAGRYIAYNGEVILAQYSAENSHPTLDGGLPYLKAIMDPVGLGMDLYGHGHGLSQWGAKRWAGYGWNATQIVTHYYTGVEVMDPASGSPLLAVTAPWPGTWLTGARAYLSAHGAREYISSVSFSTPSYFGADGNGADGWAAEWPLPGSLADPFDVTVSGSGRSHTSRLAGADLGAPVAQLSYPTLSAVQTVAVQISASDAGPSGLSRLAVGPDWSIPASSLTRQTGSGNLGPDAASFSGSALVLPAGSTSKWTGTMGALPLDAVYRAYARLRTASPQGVPVRLELLDPADDALLGFVNLRAGDWPVAGQYYDFPIDFWLPADAGGGGLGIRVISSGVAEVAFDRLRVFGAPQPFSPTFAWTLDSVPGLQTLVFQVIDAAGNTSPELIARADYDPNRPPVWELAAPTGWVTTTVDPVVEAVVTAGSRGLNPASASVRSSTDGGLNWSEWGAVDQVHLSGGSARIGQRWRDGQGGYTNLAQFRISDSNGSFSQSPTWAVPVDTDPPVLLAHAQAQPPNALGWITAPVTLTLAGHDAVSGLARILYNDGEWHEYSGPASIGGDGSRVVSYYAVDVAGLRSPEGVMEWPLDTVAPQALITVTVVISPGSPLIVSWGAREGNGVAGYEVETGDDGLVWAAWQAGGPTTTGDFGLMPDRPVYFRVRATDIAGNLGAWREVRVVPAHAFIRFPVIYR